MKLAFQKLKLIILPNENFRMDDNQDVLPKNLPVDLGISNLMVRSGDISFEDSPYAGLHGLTHPSPYSNGN